jgi:hypothetical protein
MANAGPHAIGICAARNDRENISSLASKQRLAAAVMTMTRRSMLLLHDIMEALSQIRLAKLRLGTHPSEHRPSPTLRICENAQTFVAARAG